MADAKVISGRHSDELQSLRGVAAVGVMVHHSLRVLGPFGWTKTFADCVTNAHAAVVVFFVLSGFVLGRSLMSRGLGARTIGAFYGRRFFRIFPAMWVAVTVGLLYLLIFRQIPAPHFAPWATRHFDPAEYRPISAILTYAGLDTYLLPTLWTITVELAASVALPLMMFPLMRWRWSAVPMIVVLAIVSFAAGTSLRLVPLYLVDFALGAALAVRGAGPLGKGGVIELLVACTTLLFFRLLYPWDYHAALPGLVEGVAAMVLIASIRAGNARVLSNRVAMTIGNWSYSIYLLHLPIAYICARLIDHYVWRGALNDGAPVLVALATATISIPLAGVLYRYVELPGIASGKRLMEGQKAAMQRDHRARGGAG